MLKAQVDIISVIIIFIISIGLMTLAYNFGYPLIVKRQDASISEKVENHFNQGNSNSLPNIIETIANIGGEKEVNIGTDGIWILNPDENYIQFTYISRVSRHAVNTEYPISLTYGSSCVPPIQKGILGIDKPSVVCARADKIGDRYNITYTIWFRELCENIASQEKCYKIELKKHQSGMLASKGKVIRIFFGGTDASDLNLIKKKVEILLI